MLIFIVIIIGGLGSVGGCFVGALLVALMANYIGFLAPKVALGSNILLMVADPAVAAAGPLSGGEAMSRCCARSSPATCRAAACSRVAAGRDPGRRWRSRRSCSRARRRSTSAAKICVFIVLVASYDLLLGYTGIVSFAHTMFFGIGAYGVGHRALRAGAPTWTAVAGRRSRSRSSPASCWRSLIGLFSLRVRAIFFAMITLAVASAFAILASQLSDFTGGEDGRTFRVPAMLRPGFALLERAGARRRDRRPARHLLPRVLRRRWCCSWCCCASSTRRSAACCRRSARTTSAPRRSATAPSSTARSPTASPPAWRRSPARCIALWLRYTGPDTTLSFDIMIDILLMVVIGGMGTMYGAVIGATLFVVAQNYLQDLMGSPAKAHRGAAAAAEPAAPRPLAAVARRAVRPQRLLLPDRHRRQAAPAVASSPRKRRSTQLSAQAQGALSRIPACAQGRPGKSPRRISPPPAAKAGPSLRRGGRTERHGLSSPMTTRDATADRRANPHISP